MNTKELRIGNYVNDEQTTHRVVGLDNYYIKSYWLNNEEVLYETKKQLVKPIKITEKWILSLGFKYESGLYSLNEHNFYCSIGIDEKEAITFYIDNCNQNELTRIEHLKYVHQLQNLYHALTGNDLNLDKHIFNSI